MHGHLKEISTIGMMLKALYQEGLMALVLITEGATLSSFPLEREEERF